jgi:hypothetical protein
MVQADVFQRVWVVQEIQLAMTLRIHCGDFWISWHEFSEARRQFGAIVGELMLLLELSQKMLKFRYEVEESLPARLGNF